MELKQGIGYHNDNLVQDAIRQKAYQQAPAALAASSQVIRFQGALAVGDINFEGANGCIIRPSTNKLTAWYDGNTTNTWTLPGGVETVIIRDPNSSTITVEGTDASVEIGGF